jgi:hypothetical protein
LAPSYGILNANSDSWIGVDDLFYAQGAKRLITLLNKDTYGIHNITDIVGLGPQRRMCTITQQGESNLAEWIQALRKRRRETEALDAAYDAVKKK